MTTQTASESPTNSLSVSPQGEHWQAIKVNPQPTLEEIIAKVCQQLAAIECQIETINATLKENIK
jgi:hypothetical protein